MALLIATCETFDVPLLLEQWINNHYNWPEKRNWLRERAKKAITVGRHTAAAHANPNDYDCDVCCTADGWFIPNLINYSKSRLVFVLLLLITNFGDFLASPYFGLIRFVCCIFFVVARCKRCSFADQSERKCDKIAHMHEMDGQNRTCKPPARVLKQQWTHDNASASVASFSLLSVRLSSYNYHKRCFFKMFNRFFG